MVLEDFGQHRLAIPFRKAGVSSMTHGEATVRLLESTSYR